MRAVSFVPETAPATAAGPDGRCYHLPGRASRRYLDWLCRSGGYAPSGTAQLRRGRFSYDGRTLRNGRFEFDMTTLDQAQAQLAEHLRGEDFFAVAKYPTAVFELQQVRAGIAVGQLTLHEVTRPVRFPLVVEARPDGQLRISGNATLDRTQFGIHYNSSSFFQDLGFYAIRNDFRLTFGLMAVGV